MIDENSADDARFEPIADVQVPRKLIPGEEFALHVFSWIDALAARIAWCLEHRPKSSRLFLACMLGFLCMLSFTHSVRAQNQPAGLMDTEVNTAYALTSSFGLLSNAISLAQYIFGTLAALTVIYNVLAYYIRNQSVKGVGQVVLTSILRLGLPFVVIGLAPTIIPSISLIGLQIAGDVGGNTANAFGNGTFTDAPPVQNIQGPLSALYQSMFPNNNNQNVSVTPSNIATFGEDIGFTILDKAACAVTAGKYNTDGTCTPKGATQSQDSSNTTFQANDAIMQTITYLCISIIGTFVFIAVELVIAYLQVYIVLPIAAFSLGFLGSPATSQYGSGYWTLVINTLLKFVTVVFTIGFAIAVASQWATVVANAQFNIPAENATGAQTINVGALKLAISIALASFTLLFIVRVLPSLFLGLVTGNPGSADTSIEQQAQSLGGGGAVRGGGTGSNPGIRSSQGPRTGTPTYNPRIRP